MHDLPREELRHGEPDNVRNSGCVGNDPADLRAAKAVWLGAQAQHDLVLSTVSTSKWIATRVQPVAASQSSTGWLEWRRSSGLNERMPRSAILA